jgi:hypothetical protein
MTDKFWLVVCLTHEYYDERNRPRLPKHETPTFQHLYRDQAETEALRLAKNTGKQYAVLEVVSQTKALPEPYSGHYKMIEVTC